MYFLTNAQRCSDRRTLGAENLLPLKGIRVLRRYALGKDNKIIEDRNQHIKTNRTFL